MPEIAAIKAAIDQGTIGVPVFISGRVPWYRPPEYYARSRWRGTRALDGGGALMNQGIHTVDLLLWLFGPAAGVLGRTANRLHRIEVEDTAVATIAFENGALGSVEATTAAVAGLPAPPRSGRDGGNHRPRRRAPARGRRRCDPASSRPRGLHPRHPHRHRACVRRAGRPPQRCPG